MANFVTFEDKLGHTFTAASVLRGASYPLACKIKVLEGLLTGQYWHSKCKYDDE